MYYLFKKVYFISKTSVQLLILNFQTGRLDFNASRVTGHSGPILDIKWSPFNDNVIASCSDDCTVSNHYDQTNFLVIIVLTLFKIKLWHIPDEGLSMHLTDWMVELQGHKRRVAYIEWHPTADNILFSAGFDHLVSNSRCLF